MIRIEHLTKEYANTTPLRDVSVEIHDGDVISVIGPSGTGKSTLLRCINLLEKPTAGSIWLDDTEITDPRCDISRVRQRMGMVFQSFNLFGHLTVIENIMLAPMDLKGKSRQEAYDQGMQLLRTVGLPDKALSYPDELSGGQKQRVAIARTLAMDPDVILFDEPTSALDPTMVGEVEAVIRNLARTGKTLLIVTHEMAFARAVCNRMFYMDESGIYEEGTPEQIFEHPRREKTRRFVYRLKVLEIKISGKAYDYPGTLGKIQEYCRRNQIAGRMAARMELVFEEAMQLLLSRLPEASLLLTIEYAQESDTAALNVDCSGDAREALGREDPLPLSILRSMTQKMQVTDSPNAEYSTRIVFTIGNEKQLGERTGMENREKQTDERASV